MKTRDREALLETFPFGKRIAFIAFCAERCLLEARRFPASNAQLAQLTVVSDALDALWAAVADELPEPAAIAALHTRLDAQKKQTRGDVGPLHVTLRSAVDVLSLGLARLKEADASPRIVAAAVDGPAILSATLYVAEMDARRAEVAVLDRALERLRDEKAPITRSTFEGIEDWPRTAIAPRYIDKSEKPVPLTSVPEILSAIAAAAPDARGALVKKHSAKLKSHLAHLYVTEPSDDVREALESTFLTLGVPGRNKVAESLAAMLASTAEDECARVLRGIAFLSGIDCPAPSAKTLVALARSQNLAVRAGALRCLGRLSAEQVDATVPRVLVGALTDAVEAIQKEALAALHHACTGGTYKRRDAISAFRALVGLGPDGRGQVEGALLEGLVRFVGDGSEGEQEMALEVIAKLGAAARPIAVEVARAFAEADEDEEDLPFGEALIALKPLPEECRALLVTAAARSPSSAEDANEVLEEAFGKGLPLAARIAQIERALASPDRDARVSALMAARDLPRDAGAALPILLAHGAKVASRLGEHAADEEVDGGRSELSFTRDALRAIGCPPDDLPHAPSRLEAFRGSVPSRTARVEYGYAIAPFSTITSEAPAGITLGSVGVWDDATGKFLFVVDSAELLSVLPGGVEALVVRTQGGRGTPGAAWFVERHALPSGERRSSLEVRDYVYGWPADLDVAEKGGDLVATVLVGDEDYSTRFRVRLGRSGEPDALIEAKKKADAKKVDAKKVDTKKADAKKVDAKKADAKKVDAKKVDTKKADAKKVDAKKVDAKKVRESANAKKSTIRTNTR